MNLNSMLIGSENPGALAEYYTKVFGKPAFEDSDFHSWQIGNGWVTVGPHDQVKGQNGEPGRVMWNIETSDVKGDFAKLEAAGATVVREPYQPGGGPDMWIATFSDPDNNYFQLMSAM